MIEDNQLVDFAKKYETPLYVYDREIPEIREDDLLAIRTAGAYCYAMGSVYTGGI